MKSRWVVMVATLSACALAPPRPPALQNLELVTLRTRFRDYRASEVPICDAEPRWLAEEPEAVNSVLGSFARATAAPPDSPWDDSSLALLTAGLTALPPLLEAHEANLAKVKACAGYGAEISVSLVTSGEAYV